MRRCAVFHLVGLRQTVLIDGIVRAAALVSIVGAELAHRPCLFDDLDERLYGERFTGRREIPSRRALLRMPAGGRSSYRLIAPVGVFPLAGRAIRGPLAPSMVRLHDACISFARPLLGDPGRFHAA